GLKITEDFDIVSHHQFLDDTFLFGKATIQKATELKSTFDTYSIAVGQEELGELLFGRSLSQLSK
ncbi:hypothetical protein KI387_019717, partial [Taxus chinensis]